MSAESRAGRQHLRHLVEIGRYAEARSAIETALASEPDDPRLHGLHAQALLGLGDDRAALAAASRVVGLDPEEEWGHRLCSIALDRLGQRHEALRAAAEAVRLDPHLWQTHARYAGAASRVEGRLLDALAAATRAVELAPNEPEVHNLLGLVQAARHEFEEARASYLRALALDPGHAGARNNLALLDGGLRLGRQTRGFLTALRSEPDSDVIQRNLEAFLPSVFFRIWLAFGAGLVIGLLVTIHGDAPDESDPGPVSYAVLVLLVLGTVAYVGSLVRILPRGVLGELWRRQRRSFLAWWDMVATAILVAAAVVVCTVPASGDFGIHMLRPLGLGLIIAGVASYVQRQNR